MRPLLVLGGTGRIGSALRAVWPTFPGGLRPVWQARDGRAGFLHWPILGANCPDDAASGVILCLAGGRADELASNTDLARATLAAARAQGGCHVFLASSAAVYAPGLGLDEDAATRPPSAYGAAKLAMETAAQAMANQPGAPGLTILRIGNVAGCDALLGGWRPGREVTLDLVPGQAGGPLRSYIGPASLGAVLAALVARAVAGAVLPRLLNIAAPHPVRMADLLRAAGLPWHWGPPNPAVIPAVTLDTARLQALVPLPPEASLPETMVREWRQVGGGA
ncbi:MAG: NAD-dependent epimerase/dehydratase family protein [Gemmobacter sp.]